MTTRECLAAYTKLGSNYPGYVNVSREQDGAIAVTVRADPKVHDGCYVCGHAKDKGAHGRCTPGDEHCNNYCNMAPQKGPMQDAPLPCTQVIEGATATVRLSAAEWQSLNSELAKES